MASYKIMVHMLFVHFVCINWESMSVANKHFHLTEVINNCYVPTTDTALFLWDRSFDQKVKKEKSKEKSGYYAFE